MIDLILKGSGVAIEAMKFFTSEHFINFIKRFWKIFTIIILIGVIVHMNNKYTETVIDNNETISEQKVLIDNYKISMARYTEYVNSIEKETAILKAKIKKNNSQVRNIKKEYTAMIEEIRQEKVPSKCKDSVGWFIDKSMKELKW